MSESLAIGYIHPGHVDAHFMQSVTTLMRVDAERPEPRLMGTDGGIIAIGSGPRIAEARNNIVSTFLERTRAEWLLMVDTDMVFAPEAIDKLFEAADPDTCPIVGGLCFGGGRSGIMFPTMYRIIRPEPGQSPVEVIEEYPDDALCEVDATGAAFLMMHRSVLERIGEVYGQAPYPWFLEGSAYHGFKFGEDWAFCVRAKQEGYPIHVHTGCKIGHVKPQVMDEDAWLAFKARKAIIGEDQVSSTFKEKIMGSARKAPEVPTYVVIPQKGKVDMTIRLLGQLAQQKHVAGIYIFDNGSTQIELEQSRRAAEKTGADVLDGVGMNIHQMWNAGIARIFRDVPTGPVNIAILNNDLRLGPHFLLRQATALRSDGMLTAVCPNYDGRKGEGVKYVIGTYGQGGMSGFAFMFKGELYRPTVEAGGTVFDESFSWWYGDDDFALRIFDSGRKVGLVHSVTVEHIGGGSQTAKDRPLDDITAADRQRFMEKHHFVERADGLLVRREKQEVA